MEPSHLANLYGGTDMSSVPKYNYDAQIPPDILRNIEDILTDWKPPANFLKYHPMDKARRSGTDHYYDRTDQIINLAPEDGFTGKEYLEQGNAPNWTNAAGFADPGGFMTGKVPWDDIPPETIARGASTMVNDGWTYFDASMDNNYDSSWIPGDYGGPMGYSSYFASDEQPRLTEQMAGYQYQNLDDLYQGVIETQPNFWYNDDSTTLGNDPPYSYNGATRWPFASGPSVGHSGSAPTPNMWRSEMRPDTDYEGYFKGSGYGNWPGFSLTGLTDLFNNGSVARALTEAGDKGTALSWAPTITRDQLKRVSGQHYTPQLQNARKGLLDEYQKNLNWASNIGKGFESYGGRNRTTEQGTAGYRAGIGKEMANINQQQAGARAEIEDTLAQWRELVS